MTWLVSTTGSRKARTRPPGGTRAPASASTLWPSVVVRARCGAVSCLTGAQLGYPVRHARASNSVSASRYSRRAIARKRLFWVSLLMLNPASPNRVHSAPDFCNRKGL